MMEEERRKSQRMVVQMTVDLLLSDDKGQELASPLKVELENLSLTGGSVTLSSIKADGLHLFYACHDREDRCLVLRFADSKSRRYAVCCRPAWYNRDLDVEPTSYQLGLEFSRGAEDRENIKLLNRITRGKAEKGLSEVLCDFFKKQLIRAS
jgi:hypothetical protein